MMLLMLARRWADAAGAEVLMLDWTASGMRLLMLAQCVEAKNAWADAGPKRRGKVWVLMLCPG